MWCYEVKETSGNHVLVTCDSKEQAKELLKRDLDHFISINHDSIADFEECYGEKYNDILDKCGFEVDYELYATVHNYIVADIEQLKTTPILFGGAQVFTYEEYKNMEY